MTRRPKLLMLVAVLFTLVNIAGAAYAGALGEWVHTGVHVALALAGEYAIWRLLQKRSATV